MASPGSGSCLEKISLTSLVSSKISSLSPSSRNIFPSISAVIYESACSMMPSGPPQSICVQNVVGTENVPSGLAIVVPSSHLPPKELQPSNPPSESPLTLRATWVPSTRGLPSRYSSNHVASFGILRAAVFVASSEPLLAISAST